MMVKKHELVAWTTNIADNENGRLYLAPSIEAEIRQALIDDLGAIHREEYSTQGVISTSLARRAIKANENMARYEILTGHPGKGIRYLFFAARHCLKENNLRRKLRGEFIRLCEDGRRLAGKYSREDILLEKTPRRMLDIYFELLR